MSKKKNKGKKGKNSDRHLLNSIKAKVIIGFLLFSLATLFSWLVVRYTFYEMIISVDKIAAPNYKMTLINELFRDIAELEQTQREKSMEKPHLSDKDLLAGSRDLQKKLDTLYILVHDNKNQTDRIDSMKVILEKHDQLFKRYLRIKSQLDNSDLIGQKIEEITKLVPEKTRKDSSIVKTQKQITTTTFFPDKEVEEKRSFFERLFNINNDQGIKVPSPDRVVRREENITIDTVAKITNDTLIDQAITLIDDLKQDQKHRSTQLNKQEYALLSSSGNLIRILMQLSHEIQQDEAHKEKLITRNKTNTILKDLRKFSLFIFAFFIVSGFVVFLIFFDISRSNYLREKLEQAKSRAEHLSRVKQRFLANMSHEIRTPLQSIIGFSEQLVKRPDLVKKATQAIYRSSQHLLYLVNEVLDYSKLESNTFTLNNQPFNMKKVLYEVIEVVEDKCKKNNLRFQYLINFSSLDRLYLGDAFRLKQILFNLLDNAIKYTEKGSVLLRVIDEKKELSTHFKIYVDDTGVGISTEDRQKIFHQFEQINHHTHPPQDGIGLGLGIVKALVDAKRGALEVDSEPGEGSTFLVTLTYDHVHSLPKKVVSLQGPQKTQRTEHVMVIDDDKFILELYEVIFKLYNVKYQLFKSPEDFLRTDLNTLHSGTTILVDYRLPGGITGDQLASKIKSKIRKAIRCIAVTAYAPKEEISELLNQHFDDLLFKPFTEKELLDVLNIRINDHQLPKVIEQRIDDLNLENLYHMAGNDEELIQSFIRDFARESERDIRLLKKAVTKKDLLTMANILHRISGRCSHLGAPGLALDYRKLEMMIRAKKSSSPNRISFQKMDRAITKLETLIHQLNVQKFNYV